MHRFIAALVVAVSLSLGAGTVSAHSGYYDTTVPVSRPGGSAQKTTAYNNCLARRSNFLSYLRSTGHVWYIINNCVYGDGVYYLTIRYSHPTNSSGSW